MEDGGPPPCPSRYLLRVDDTDWNLVFAFDPIVDSVPITATAIRAAINAYSIIAAPFCDFFEDFLTNDIFYSFVIKIRTRVYKFIQIDASIKTFGVRVD